MTAPSTRQRTKSSSSGTFASAAGSPLVLLHEGRSWTKSGNPKSRQLCRPGPRYQPGATCPKSRRTKTPPKRKLHHTEKIDVSASTDRFRSALSRHSGPFASHRETTWRNYQERG